MDLEGDAELESLRLAALATLKSRASKKEEPEPLQVDNISKVSTVITSKAFDQSTYGKKDNIDKVLGSNHNNQHSWRNSAPTRGRGRGKLFPKINQRSNLIVITPVSLNEKKPCDKEATPQLMLPQHKWCQSVNEDSSSPKSFRKTGPTRFNRHRSRSDSSDSDSDYENSDNDSYSNETILQDEPSEKFNRHTPDDNTEDSVQEPQRISDRRLSFQNINSSLALDNSTPKEPEDTFDSSKNTYLNCTSVNRKTSITMPRESEPESKKVYTNYNQYTLSSGDKDSLQARELSPIQSERSQIASNLNGRSHSKKDLSGNVTFEKDKKYSRKYSEKPLENNFYGDSTVRNVKNHVDNLSEGDLRFEIKKKLQKSKSEIIHSSQSQYESFNHNSYEQSQDNFHRKHSQSAQCNEIHNFPHKNNSREDRTRSRKNRSRSTSLNRTHSISPVKNSFNQTRLAHSRTDHYYKRERSSNSSERSYKRSRNQSPDLRSAVQSINRSRRCSGSSSSSTSSSSYSSSSSSSSSRRQIRSVPSVVKPVSKIVDLKSRGNISLTEKHSSSAELDSVIGSKRGRDSDEKWKITSSAIKSSGYDTEKRTIDGNKRVPVHMRLGTLPCKRLIKVAKDVEAVFVNTSSDDETDVNMRCKKQNYRVVTEMCGTKLDEVSKRHVEKSTYRNVEVMKDRSRRVKIER